MAHNFDTKSLLWRNVQILMRQRYGKENLTAFARDCGLGPGTASRIKESETSVGLDVIEKIAVAFEVAPWLVIAPAKHDAPAATVEQLLGRIRADVSELHRLYAARRRKRP